ncbi:hypothetical protein ACF0H5_019419 [Mactra antiquata]
MSSWKAVMCSLMVILLSLPCFYSSPVVSLNDQTQQLTAIRRARDIGEAEYINGQSPASGRVLRMLFNGKQHLLNYLSSRNHEEKRQRQCYWSVISCF